MDGAYDGNSAEVLAARHMLCRAPGVEFGWVLALMERTELALGVQRWMVLG
jgi:hypothetical protein